MQKVFVHDVLQHSVKIGSTVNLCLLYYSNGLKVFILRCDHEQKRFFNRLYVFGVASSACKTHSACIAAWYRQRFGVPLMGRAARRRARWPWPLLP